jgi:hypothetical protein
LMEHCTKFSACNNIFHSDATLVELEQHQRHVEALGKSMALANSLVAF